MYKKLFYKILIVSIFLILFACEKNTRITEEIKETEKVVAPEKNKDDKYVEVAKNFYTEYLTELDNFDDDFMDRINAVRKKYMTDILIEEIDLRNRESDCDSIIEAQDGYGFLDMMEVKSSNKDGWAKVIFDDKTNEVKRIFDLHFIEIDGKTLINAIDSTVIEKDMEGKLEERVRKTKYANKETLDENDRKEIEDKKKYYEDLYEQGYIG